MAMNQKQAALLAAALDDLEAAESLGQSDSESDQLEMHVRVQRARAVLISIGLEDVPIPPDDLPTPGMISARSERSGPA